MTSFADNLSAIRQRIADACRQFGKDPARIGLLAVSKTFPGSAVTQALGCGITAFGENYVQEGVAKIAELASDRPRIQWHFIGPLQSNKTKDIAEHFDWMHSIDREKIARRLSEQRPAAMTPLCVCIQVNVSGEASKSGAGPEETKALALTIAQLPRLSLRGLMAIPEPTEDIALQRARFAQLAALFKDIKPALPVQAQQAFDTLSMGMSADLESAIAESIPEAQTMVRIGTALFGVRAPK
jgi:pyridoxal phosphate enzyme (YggS family)